MKSEKRSRSSVKKSPAGKAAKESAPVKLSRAQKPEDMTLEQWQLGLRKQFAEQQEFGKRSQG